MKRSILMLEQDEDDRYITQAVFDENRYPVTLHFVESSNDLFAFLVSCEKKFMSFPSVILLNHNASPRNAVEIIKELKSNSLYAHIPVVVLSGSANHELLHRCYEVGANSFIIKPSSTKEINDKISTFIRYWFETVALP